MNINEVTTESPVGTCIAFDRDSTNNHLPASCVDPHTSNMTRHCLPFCVVHSVYKLQINDCIPRIFMIHESRCSSKQDGNWLIIYPGLAINKLHTVAETYACQKCSILSVSSRRYRTRWINSSTYRLVPFYCWFYYKIAAGQQWLG